TCTQVALPPPLSCPPQVATWLASALQSAARTTAFRGPLGGVKMTVTTWLLAVRSKPGEPLSQERSVISTESPAAANGRVVLPSGALKVGSAVGITLQPARAGWGRAASSVTRIAVKSLPNARGTGRDPGSTVSRQKSYVMEGSNLPLKRFACLKLP